MIDGARRCALASSPGAPPLSFAGDDRFASAELVQAAAFSVNCAFAKLHQIVGGDVVAELARQLGFAGVIDGSPRLVIGSTSATPLEMASAMSVVLGDGTLRRGGLVSSVGGDESVAISVQVTEVVQAETAAITADLLRGVVEFGTARSNGLDDGRPAAGKTGTQENNTDAWFVGGTPQISVAVWIGNPADPSDQMVSVAEFVGVGRVSGGSYPAAVWKRFVDAALANQPVATWPTPTTERAPLRLIVDGVECSPAPMADVGFSAIAIDAPVSDCR